MAVWSGLTKMHQAVAVSVTAAALRDVNSCGKVNRTPYMATQRRYDLDWLRALGMVVVFLFHVSMFMNTWGWHVKNLPGYAPFDLLNRVTIPWIMPLFFIISGIGTHYALQRRSGGAFLKERLLRLGVPVLVGAFLLSPHQVWIERVTKGQFSGSFLQFIPHYFEGFYELTPGGNFAWMGLHLWYLLFLLLFSVITLPLVRRLGLWERLGAAVGAPGLLLLPPVVLALLRFVLDPDGAGKSITGWPLLLYLLFYLMGAGLFPLAAFRQAVRQQTFWLVGAAIASTLFYVLINNEAPFGQTTAFAISCLGWVSAGWFSLVALFGLAERYLTKENGLLRYAGGAVMPIYMLHQPVIVLIGFWIRAIVMAPVLKFSLLFIAAGSLVLAIHHLLVRHVPLVQLLMGVKLPPTGQARKAA